MPRRSIFGEVKDTNKRGQCQIYSNIAERKYLRQAKDTKSRKQCKLICFLPRRNILGAAKVRFSFVSPRPAEDVPEAAGGAMPPSAWGGCWLPLFGCGRRANLSKLYFSRPPACGIALQKQPNSHFGKHPAPPIRCLLQEADLPLLSPKGGAKSVRRAPPSGSDGAMRNLRCAARNDDYLLVSVLAGLRPAGSHCEKSGKIPTLHCIPSGTTNPVILRRKSKPIPTQTSTPASPRKQRRKRPCPIGFRHICPKTEK